MKLSIKKKIDNMTSQNMSNTSTDFYGLSQINTNYNNYNKSNLLNNSNNFLNITNGEARKPSVDKLYNKKVENLYNSYSLTNQNYKTQSLNFNQSINNNQNSHNSNSSIQHLNEQSNKKMSNVNLSKNNLITFSNSNSNNFNDNNNNIRNLSIRLNESVSNSLYNGNKVLSKINKEIDRSKSQTNNNQINFYNENTNNKEDYLGTIISENENSNIPFNVKSRVISKQNKTNTMNKAISSMKPYNHNAGIIESVIKSTNSNISKKNNSNNNFCSSNPLNNEYYNNYYGGISINNNNRNSDHDDFYKDKNTIEMPNTIITADRVEQDLYDLEQNIDSSIRKKKISLLLNQHSKENNQPRSISDMMTKIEKDIRNQNKIEYKSTDNSIINSNNSLRFNRNNNSCNFNVSNSNITNTKRDIISMKENTINSNSLYKYNNSNNLSMSNVRNSSLNFNYNYDTINSDLNSKRNIKSQLNELKDSYLNMNSDSFNHLNSYNNVKPVIHGTQASTAGESSYVPYNVKIMVNNNKEKNMKMSETNINYIPGFSVLSKNDDYRINMFPENNFINKTINQRKNNNNREASPYVTLNNIREGSLKHSSNKSNKNNFLINQNSNNNSNPSNLKTNNISGITSGGFKINKDKIKKNLVLLGKQQPSSNKTNIDYSNKLNLDF